MTTSRKLFSGLLLLTVATPLGLIAKGSAWGEWAAQELGNRLGFVPQGLARLETLWHAALAGYKVPGHAGRLGYFVSALIGSGLIGALTFFLGKLLAKRSSK